MGVEWGWNGDTHEITHEIGRENLVNRLNFGRGLATRSEGRVPIVGATDRAGILHPAGCSECAIEQSAFRT